MGTTIDEAMERVIEIPNRDALMDFLRKNYEFWKPTEENVTIKFYAKDDRIGWNTYLICVDGKAALFSDSDFPSSSQSGDQESR